MRMHRCVYMYSVHIYAFEMVKIRFCFNVVWLIVSKLGGDVQLVFVAGLSLKLGKSTLRSNVHTDLKPLLHCIGWFSLLYCNVLYPSITFGCFCTAGAMY